MAKNIGEQFGTVVPGGGKQPSQTGTRMKQVKSELIDGILDDPTGKFCQQDIDRLTNEYRTLKSKLKAAPYAGGADSAATNYQTKAFGAGGDQFAGHGYEPRNLSPLDLDLNQTHDMWTALKHKQPYRAEIKAFGAGGGFGGPGGPPIGTKTTGQPISEGSPYPGGLFPSVLQPDLTTELRFEYDRLADHIPTIAIDAPSISYVVETGLTNPAAVVSEQGVKADIGVQTDTQICTPVKLAALASVTFEALQDFSYFAGMLSRTLYKALVDIETSQLVLGTGTGGEMNGIIPASGLLTRAYNGAHDVSGIDTLLKAATDVRVGSSFAEITLWAMSPQTWENLKATKTTTDAFVLGIMDPNSIGTLDNLWGVRVVTNTKIPQGTAIGFSQELFARYFVRSGITIESNPYGDLEWTTNTISFRCESRSNLAILRPSAGVICTGLYPYSGS